MKRKFAFPPEFSPSTSHRIIQSENPPSQEYRGGDVAAWQRRLRPRIRRLLGKRPEGRCPLHVRTIWRREHPLGLIEKIVFTSEPGSDVPAYVCLPKDVRPPYRFFVCLQGHTTGMHLSIGVSADESEAVGTVVDGDYAIGCMARGIAALCIEQRAIGEREERVQENVAPKRCQDASMQALMLGRTLVGERVFDLERAVDYLEERGDVDMRRLGVLGHSGGGTVALYGAALNPRIKTVICSGYFCTFGGSVMAMKSCICNYIPGLLQVAEMPDIAGLIAPRPLVLVNGRRDEMIPIAASQKAFRHLKRIYAACGAGDRCKLVIGPEGHRFYSAPGWRAMEKYLQRL